MNANDFVALVEHWAAVMKWNKDYLIELDGVVGDSDLGLTMSDGFAAAYNAIAKSTETDIGKLSYNSGKSMSSEVPSTMGTLMASGFMQAGKALKGITHLDAGGVAVFFEAFLEGVKKRGKAGLGEKTFVDGFEPAVRVLKEYSSIEPSEYDVRELALKAAKAAEAGFNGTKGMLAKHGRAAGRGEQARDMLDPGAAVAYLLIKGYADFLDR